MYSKLPTPATNDLAKVLTPQSSPSTESSNDVLSALMAKAHSYALLEKDAELALGKTIQAGKLGNGQLTPAATRALHELILANLRLCIFQAKRYRQDREQVMELAAAGFVGLTEAALKFDPQRELRFNTYAIWPIRSHMIQHLRQQNRIVHLPKHIHEEITKLIKAEACLVQVLGRTPTEEELLQALKWTNEALCEIRSLQNFQSSLDAPVEDNEAHTLGDTLPDMNAINPAQAASEKIDGDFVRRQLSALDAREALIITLRFGLNGPEQTLDEIGVILKISRERVRQLEERALLKLRSLADSGFIEDKSAA